ncbi:MAG: sulfurtransferase TusA family protein [Cellvibrio sp.]
MQDSDLPAMLREVESSSAVTRAVNLEVDARQLACPLPLLKAKQALRNLAVNELVRVLTTDAGSLKDFVSFAQLTGQLLESFCIQDNYYCFVIRKQ